MSAIFDQQTFFREYSYLCKSHKIDKNTKIQKIIVNADKLIIPWRLDFMSKLLLLDSWDDKYEKKNAEEIYEQHLVAFSGGTLVERGQGGKVGIQRYYDTFKELKRKIAQKEDIVINEWPAIPVDKRYLVLDGAHRAMTAFFYKKQIEIYYIDISVPANYKYDFLFFRKRYLDEKYILEMVKKYISIKDCRCYLLERISSANYKKIYREYAPVYMKKVDKSCIVILDETWCRQNNKDCELKDILIEKWVYLKEKDEMLDFLKEKEEILIKRRFIDNKKAMVGKVYQRIKNLGYIWRDKLLKRTS